MDPRYYSAPVAQRPTKLSNKVVLGGIGLLLLVIFGVMLLAFSGGNNIGDQITRAVFRQQQLITLTDDAKKNIRSAELMRINADANLFLKSDLGTLTSLMASTGVEKVPKDIAAQEVDTTTKPRLEQALSSSRFDDTYKLVLSQKISSQQALLSEIHPKVGDAQAQRSLSEIYNKLESVQKQLANLK
ncbi:hypothetical protein CYG49_03205 [Candidatus Saccharibacteria bacterium]|nr:MAG: hypothetical protein CYG49_03205 [Candidatus Saccharibacteria bacterium]